MSGTQGRRLVAGEGTTAAAIWWPQNAGVVAAGPRGDTAAAPGLWEPGVPGAPVVEQPVPPGIWLTRRKP
ncbi:MAG: hypothetical protein AB1445_15675 [Bacillota bacterium]